MPTVHLSLPEAVYKELKEVAESMGIQITDLIKVLIRDGLKRIREGNDFIAASSRNKYNVPEDLEDRLAYIEGKIHILSELLDSTLHRLERLESLVSSVLPIEVPTKEK